MGWTEMSDGSWAPPPADGTAGLPPSLLGWEPHPSGSGWLAPGRAAFTALAEARARAASAEAATARFAARIRAIMPVFELALSYAEKAGYASDAVAVRAETDQLQALVAEWETSGFITLTPAMLDEAKSSVRDLLP